MIVYHGSKEEIIKPEFGKGNPKNDYGLGFYCTEDIELAKEWACTAETTNGYANKYEIDLNKLRVLNLQDKKYSILNWIAILIKFRTLNITNEISRQNKDYIIKNFYIDIDNYDVIIGYRADDSYFTFARDFISNSLSLQQLGKVLYLGKLGTQVVIKSEKAFNSLKFLGSEIAESEEYYRKRIVRDKEARDLYFGDYRNITTIEDIFVVDIIRKELKNGDKIL